VRSLTALCSAVSPCASAMFPFCRDMWTPLAAPCKFLAIEFYSCDANMQPFDCQLGFDVTTDGSCNGMAFWFDLQLDEQSSISSSPFVRKVMTSVIQPIACLALPQHALLLGTGLVYIFLSWVDDGLPQSTSYDLAFHCTLQIAN